MENQDICQDCSTLKVNDFKRRSFIRRKVLNQYFFNYVVQNNDSKFNDAVGWESLLFCPGRLVESGKIFDDCTQNAILNPLMNEVCSESTEDTCRVHPFPEKDILRFTANGITPSADLKKYIWEEVTTTLTSMSKMLSVGDGTSNEEPHIKIWRLLDDIKIFQSQIQQKGRDICQYSSRINDRLLQVADLHTRLQLNLRAEFTMMPRNHFNMRSASHDLLATTAEISLIKLSLIRAETHQALYNFKSEQGRSKSKATLSQALTIAYSRLLKEERKMKEEEASHNQKLQEYEHLLSLVDGDSGGYKELIDDWTKVKRETEECKQDLRRLGWTGNG